MQTTVTLSENAFRQISTIADMTDQTIEEVIEKTFASKLEKEIENLKETIAFCSDKEVLELANLKMSADENEEMSRLLRKNSESKMTDNERAALDKIVRYSQQMDLRKAIGIVEAQKRGLIESVENLNWSDEDVLALANLKLLPKQDRRLSKLLEDQRESRLTMNEKIELEGLMGLYNLANIRKSEGILEAVKRKLISSPKDLDE